MYPSGGALMTAQRKCGVRGGKLVEGKRGAGGADLICLSIMSMTWMMHSEVGKF
jgi:hypothetical protein